MDPWRLPELHYVLDHLVAFAMTLLRYWTSSQARAIAAGELMNENRLTGLIPPNDLNRIGRCNWSVIYDRSEEEC